VSRRILVLNERDLRHQQAGGAEVHCFEIFSRLAAGGDDVTLLAAGFPGAAAEETVEGVRVVRLGNRITYYALVPGAYRRLRRTAPPDVVVEDLNKFPFFACLWVREPLVVFAHHLFGLTAFRQVAFPIAVATYLAERLVPRLYRGIPVVAVSPSTRDELVAGGMRPADIHVIPNGSITAATRRRHARPCRPYSRWDGSGPTSGPSASSTRSPSCRRSPRRRRGRDGPRRRAGARRRAGRRPRALRGFVDEDEKVRLLQTSHVLATASEKEGWGLTVLEAAACGTPAVATDAPGLRDSVRDGETGLLVPPDDPAALARALGRVLGDAALRERLGRAAIVWAARFEWGAVTREISQVLDAARGLRPALAVEPAS
jgi:glycosyltransferase involved in cell wall biosynthesis